MIDTIRDYIAQCFSRESREAARAEAFALLAEKEGHIQLARVFRVLAEAKSVHAKRFGHLMRGKIATTEENLREALDSEAKNAEDYAAMAREVKQSDASLAVQKGFIQTRKTTEEAVGLLRAAVEDRESEISAGYCVCRICGHIHAGEIPSNCPVCGAVPGRFVKIP